MTFFLPYVEDKMGTQQFGLIYTLVHKFFQNFLQASSVDGLKNWMHSYVIPLILEKDGLSEKEIKSWYEDGGPPEGPHVNASTMRLMRKDLRDETIQGPGWQTTWKGLI